MECRLEDLNEELLRKIMQFCELPEAPKVMQHFRDNFDPHQPGGRTIDADPQEVELVSRLIEPTKIWLESVPIAAD